jgi:hypothetical protein
MYLAEQKDYELNLADVGADRRYYAYYVKRMRHKSNIVNMIFYHALVNVSLHCVDNYMRLMIT